ncbi:HsdM family class I SAM-dependent methyltransferase [Mycolicibacterium goodii]|uniref:HsdM family class I SAM-dependent methyltransferase n=1 Tax=Mycolicibacterium goodii TaxID=134601 RepID=UPI001056C72F|nr:N-6 DNA methylase [Mycolicibacterium goodii]
MPKKSDRLRLIRARLKEAGYRLVELEPRVGDKKAFRPDVLAYASNADGDLVPWAVVEAKRGLVKPESALPALMKAQELLGTVDHYCLVDDRWYRADRSLRSLEQVEGPAEPAHGASGFLTDVSLATSLILDRLWIDSDHSRGFLADNDTFVSLDALFAATAIPGIQTTGGDFIAVAPDVLWQAQRSAVSAFATRGRLDGDFTTDPLIADAIATLVKSRLGGVVLDPFCGTGNFLWAALDQARQLDALTEFFGRDINQAAARLARALAATAPLPTLIETGDSLSAVLPEADVVITAPPFGGRLSEPLEMMDGSRTRELELAAIDRCLEQLRPGGRAGFLLSASVTFKRSAEGYRRYLANNFRIAALIGLPSGAYFQAGIRTVLLVIDRAAPGETFVAQLGDDWRTQLASGGGVLHAVLQHLDGDIGGE